MILLTGATGFVGKRVLTELLARNKKVVCIARTPSKLPEHENLIVLRGDLEQSEVLTNPSDIDELKNITTVIHMAALYDLAASAGACYMANVVASMNLLSLSRKLGKVEKLIYISTVAVAGDYDGQVPHDEVDFGQKYPNYYAKTKAQAENLFRRGVPSDKLCILRPGIIVGDSRDGVYDKADGPYMAIEFFKRLLDKAPLLKRLPAYPLPMLASAQLPLVSVDVVVNVIVEAALASGLSGCHHIVCPDAPTVLEFAREMFKRLGYQGTIKPTLGAKELASLIKRLPDIPNFPAPLIDYMSTTARFDVSEESRRFKSIESVTWTGFQDVFFREAIRTL